MDNKIAPFSVLMSVYRNENSVWFRESLDCILAQTVRPSEIVLVKDGPLTPELESVISDYVSKYPIFNIVINEKNLGLGLALQKGLLTCKNDIVARMDTDDVMPTDRFEKQLIKMLDGYDVVSCWSKLFVGEKSNVIAVKKRPENHDDIVRLAHRRSPVCHAAAFLRKSAVLSAGNYQHRQLYEDYNLWVRMILTGAKFYNVQEILYEVRTTEDQLKRRSGWKYLKSELSNLKEFYNLGFYSFSDWIINASIRIVIRLMPEIVRSVLLKVIWRHQSR